MDSLILPWANTQSMQFFIDEIARRYPDEKIVMIADGASWHTTEQLVFPVNLRIRPLPAYAPELNPVEHIWDELREKFFHNLAFDSLHALENQLVTALRHLENNPQIVRSITAWEWIIHAL